MKIYKRTEILEFLARVNNLKQQSKGHYVDEISKAEEEFLYSLEDMYNKTLDFLVKMNQDFRQEV